MKPDDTLQAEVLNYFTAEFGAIEQKLKSGEFNLFRERVQVSQRITEAVSLLAPYVRSDPRARYLVKNAEALKKELLSVREIIVKQIKQQKVQQSLLQAILANKRANYSVGSMH